jgi:hypothetical protein
MEDATMKNFTKWMMAAAAMAVVAGGASAQTTLKAEVPFAFRTAGGRLDAGSYEMLVKDKIICLRNVGTKKTTMARVAYPLDIRKEWKNDLDVPRIAFECAGSDCGLLAIYAGDRSPALGFDGLRGKHHEAQIAMVPLTVVKP